ncbi:MAG: PEGA domain-containing protein [Myxococcales bacterium]
MRLLLCLWLLGSLPAFAQEDSQPNDSEPPDEATSTMHPGSDSPEAQHAGKYDGPRHRVQAFLIPMDEGARTPTARVAQALEGVLQHTPMYSVVDLGRALRVESTAEQAQHADAGRDLLKEADDAAATRGWPEAAAKYQHAVQEFEKGLPAVGPREYAEAVLRDATATYMSGEDKAARELFALAVRLDPQQRLTADEAVAPQLQQARAELTGAKRVSLDVDVRPAGARVFVDGELRGQHVEVPAGRHLLKVERAGFYPYAEIIELAPRKPVKASITLAATPTATSLNQIIAGASDEVGRGEAGKSVAQLAQKFSLERVLIGSLHSQDVTKVSIVLALVDAAKHRVIASKTMLLVADGTDADQIEADTQAAARKLISSDDAPEPVQPVAEVKPETVRKPVMPGAPVADPPTLVSKHRKVVMPADAAAPGSKEIVKKEADKKKKKSKGLQAKTGTEEWDDD